MVDTNLIVESLRLHGHSVNHIIPLPENAGEYEFEVDGGLLTMAEVRRMLEREDLQH